MAELTNAEYNAQQFLHARFSIDVYRESLKNGYLEKWVKRFETNHPETYMDEASVEIHKKLKDSGRYLG